MSDQEREIRELPRPIDAAGALAEALGLLTPLGVSPVLIGGVALGVHGIERYTKDKDVDLAVLLSDMEEIERAVRDHDPQTLRIGGISFQTSTGIRVDLIDRRIDFGPLYQEAITAARNEGPFARVAGVEVPVVPLTYLVALKMAADRPLDEVDLAQLLAREDLDYPRARDVVHRHLGIFAARRLDRIARDTGRRDAPHDYENGDS